MVESLEPTPDEDLPREDTGEAEPAGDGELTERTEPWPATAEANLRISVGACRVRLAAQGSRPDPAGEGREWVSIRYQDPTGTLPLSVTRDHGTVRISQHARWSDVRGFRAGVPELTVTLSPARAMTLTVDSGASEVNVDLGGLWLRRAGLRMGAGTATVSCSTPTVDDDGGLARMDVEAGAASVLMTGLANLGAEQLVVSGGAASYDLSFDGALREDIAARVTTAGASVVIRVPTSLPARIGVVSVLAGLTAGDGYQTWEDSYWTRPGVEGQRPMLSLDASVTLGSLELAGPAEPDEEEDADAAPSG